MRYILRVSFLADHCTDYTMSFWDTSDNFNFEKTILNKSTNLHTQIYYINYWSYWLTVDDDWYIHVWNLTDDTYETLPRKNIKNVLDVWEVIQMKLTAISWLDKEIMLWNIEKKILVSKIPLNSISAHTLAYMHDYRVLATATYGNKIYLYRIYSEDVSTLGQLFGHLTTVTSIHALESKYFEIINI